MKTFQTFDISAEYDAIHRTFPCHKDAPVIGLTGNFQEGACTLLEGYFTSILKAGGIPFIIPPVDETNSLINSLNALDGLLLTGGADINPCQSKYFVDSLPYLLCLEAQIFQTKSYIFRNRISYHLVIRILKDHPDCTANGQQIIFPARI